MSTMGRCSIGVAALAMIALPAPAQSTAKIRRLYPASAHCCVDDEAHVLGAAELARIDSSLRRIKASTHFNIAVVTLPTIDDVNVNDVALQIGRDWGVGSSGAGSDSGARGMVVLVVPKSRSTRGQVSTQLARGAEGFLTDATIGEIRRRALDDFRAARYGAGIEKIIDDVESRVIAASTEPPAAIAPAPVVKRSHGGAFIVVISVIVGGLLALVFALVLVRRRRNGGNAYARRSSWDTVDAGLLAASIFANDSGSNDSSSDSPSSSSSDSSSSFDGGGDYGGGGGSDSF